MKKKIISTLEFDKKECGKATGNTTRQIDFAIDNLYKGNAVKVEDHSELTSANKLLFDKIIKRLYFEHNLSYLEKTNKIKINKNKLTIEFL